MSGLMTNSPAYLWYPKDILSSGRVAALTLEEELWYRRALDQSWLAEGLPSDPGEFAGWVGRGCTVESATKLIEKFFVPHKKDDAKVVNLRQEEERTKLKKKSAERSKAGKASGCKRRENKELSDEQMFNKMRTKSNIPIPIPIPIPKDLKKKNSGAIAPEQNQDNTLSTSSDLDLAKAPPDSAAPPPSSHPAIAAMREVIGKYPNKALWEDIIVRLGTEPNIVKLKECRVAWITKGYNANAITWLDWYFNGIPHYNGKPDPRTESYAYVRGQPTQREAIEAEQKMIAEMAKERGIEL